MSQMLCVINSTSDYKAFASEEEEEEEQPHKKAKQTMGHKVKPYAHKVSLHATKAKKPLHTNT